MNPDEDMREACNQSLVKALNSAHQKIRKELGVPGSFLAREPGPPHEPTLPSAPG
ncbi:hypothetical protein OG589_20155 [Sphaerisporangium sp. NBC_01403]|uniref:hypothetical protein n=1 Tax=Sphaerisporangium sp. NBC_01403 TaxID=2903599 RepID=UPI0032496299